MGKPTETIHFGDRWQRPATCGFWIAHKPLALTHLQAQLSACVKTGVWVSKQTFSALSSHKRPSSMPFGTKTKTQRPVLHKSFETAPVLSTEPTKRQVASLGGTCFEMARKVGVTGMTEQ